MRHILISLILFTLSPCDAFAVIGGNSAPELARYAVMILSKKGEICSGTVISRHSILTAAHCVRDGSEYAVHYRTLSGEPVLISPSKIITHPNYVPDAITKRVRSIDLAIVQLKEPISSQFEPIQLSTKILRSEDGVIIGGYGLTDEKSRSSNGHFLSTSLRVVEPYGPSTILVWLKGEPVIKSNLNAGGCHGDSGGPIFSDNTLVAITTWTTGPKGYECGELTQGVLIAPQMDWISKNAY